MRITHKDGYKSGDYWVICPRCGWDWLKSQMVIESETGKEVCPECADEPSSTKSISAKW